MQQPLQGFEQNRRWNVDVYGKVNLLQVGFFCYRDLPAVRLTQGMEQSLSGCKREKAIGVELGGMGNK